jgi:hypothetical protein
MRRPPPGHARLGCRCRPRRQRNRSIATWNAPRRAEAAPGPCARSRLRRATGSAGGPKAAAETQAGGRNLRAGAGLTSAVCLSALCSHRHHVREIVFTRRRSQFVRPSVRPTALMSKPGLGVMSRARTLRSLAFASSGPPRPWRYAAQGCPSAAMRRTAPSAVTSCST